MAKSNLLKTLTFLALTGLQTPALAADPVPDPATAPSQIIEDRWSFKITPYLWMAAMGGKTAAGDSFEMPFHQVLDDLSFALMTSIAAEKGRFGIYSDLIYLNLQGSDSATGNIVGNPVTLNLDATIQGFITTNALGYRVIDTPTTKISGYGGFRYFWMDVDLDFALGGFRASANSQGSVFDGVIGLRGETKLSDRWALTYLGDIGTGQSEVTWQAFGGLGYAFESFDLFAGYRAMRWQFDNTAKLDDFYTHGPVVGARFRF